ncbi:MAG TPA: phosphoglycerate dehydrogenase [Bacteroidota bacterium]|nr:phosphoglycerate dehydrogenase [Bacteroidota bacterium]
MSASLKILITDQVDERCCGILQSEGFAVEYKPGLPAEEIRKSIAGASALIVRSQTTVDAAILEAGKMLKVVGRAGAGVDNIDVDAATRLGVIVMNTPGGNTISTAEHTISMMMAMARNIPQADMSLRQGKWERKKFTGTELHGKTIGIVGLGKVGLEVGKRCLAFEMTVIAYDPVLSPEIASKYGIELVELAEVFRRSDFITLHSPLTDETRNILNSASLAKCKRGVRIINCARGGIVDEKALLAALNEGSVAGAALDVFEEEPPKNSPLVQHPHVVATPHLGASTEEAQEKVAIQIAHQVADLLHDRGIAGSVNADTIRLAQKKELRPYMLLAEKMGSLLGQLKKGKLQGISVSATGKILEESISAVGAAVLKGAIEKTVFEPVNYLSAPLVARERGIKADFRVRESHSVYAQMITVQYTTDKESNTLSGTIFGTDDERIVEMNGFFVEVKPEGWLLFYSNIDRPGMVAGVSGILANGQINIARLSLGRFGIGKGALTVVSTDSPIPEAILKQISALPGVEDVRSAIL